MASVQSIIIRVFSDTGDVQITMDMDGKREEYVSTRSRTAEPPPPPRAERVVPPEPGPPEPRPPEAPQPTVKKEPVKAQEYPALTRVIHGSAKPAKAESAKLRPANRSGKRNARGQYITYDPRPPAPESSVPPAKAVTPKAPESSVPPAKAVTPKAPESAVPPAKAATPKAPPPQVGGRRTKLSDAERRIRRREVKRRSRNRPPEERLSWSNPERYFNQYNQKGPDGRRWISRAEMEALQLEAERLKTEQSVPAQSENSQPQADQPPPLTNGE